MKIMECEEGSEKGRVVAILAVAASSFVTTAIVFCGMLFLAPIMLRSLRTGDRPGL